MSSNDVAVLRQVIQKLVPMISNKGVKVTQRGLQAYVKHNPRTLEPEVVNLPMLPDNVSDDLVLAIQGFLDHEVGHILETDPRWNLKAQAISPRVKFLWNAIEDTFVERRMQERFPGSAFNIDLLHEFFLANMVRPNLAQATSVEQQLGTLMVPMIRAWSTQRAFVDFMNEGHWATIQPHIANVPQALIDRIKQVKSSKDSYELAVALDIALGKPPKQDADPNQESEPGESGSEMKVAVPVPSKEKPEPQDEPEDDDDSGTPQPGAAGEEEPEETETNPSPEEADGEEAHDDGSASGEPEEDEDDQQGQGGAADDSDEPDSDDEPEDENDQGAGEEDDGPESDSQDEETSGAAGDGEPEEDDEGDAQSEDGEDDEPQDDEGEENDPGQEEEDPSDEIHDADGDDADDAQEVSIWDNALGEGMENDQFDEAIARKIAEFALDAISNADYSVYTKDNDDISLFEPTENAEILAERAAKLDDATRQMVGVMQSKIERMVAARSQAVNIPGFRSGKLHSAALHKIIMGRDDAFRRRQVNHSKDTAVTLLVDCSGSMSGEKFVTAMVAAYALGLTLDRVGIKHEIIGFTTGRANIDAIEAAREEADKNGINFSRIDTIYMPIFKSFEERFSPAVKGRLAGANSGVRMGSNVDGESVQYAARRLVVRKETRKIMIVLSDGNPAVSGTSWGHINEGRQHLKKVVQEELPRMGIESVGIGIMDDAVSHFYPKYVVLQKVEELPNQIMKELQIILA